ncbi:MAG TPA: hypothetical protein VFZ17_12910 [Acidimicrobiia bacterium]|nr:hypothetical protein [Acidimicrobiia bacterium]
MSAVEPQRPIDKFRKSAAGSVIAAGLLGIRDVMEGRPEAEETVLESEAAGAPPPDGIELFLDPDHPERSIVVIHPVQPTSDTDAIDE